MKFFRQILRFSCLIPFFWLLSVLGQTPPDSLPQEQPDSALVRELLVETEESFDQTTPRGAVLRHFHYLRPEHFHPEWAAEVIPGDLPLEKKIELAIQLRDVFNARGEFIETDLIPDRADYVDSVSGQSKYFLSPKKYPTVFLTRKNGIWSYSQTTVSSIPELYKDAIPRGAEWFQQLLPNGGKAEWLGMPSWKWLGLVLILVVSFGLYVLLRIVLGWMFRRVVPKLLHSSPIDPALIPPVARPLSILLVILLFYQQFMPMLLLPIEVTHPLRNLALVLMSVFGVMTVYKLVNVVASLFLHLASKTASTMDDQLIPLLARIAKAIVVVFGLLFVLDNLEVNVTALLAGVSIGGLAIALAAQDTVKNFIGSISIFVDRPFMIGDLIQAGDIEGTVTEVGVRTTRLRSLDGATITVPNGDLASRVITNLTVREYRRYATSITVTYKTRPEQLEAFVEGVREIVLAHPKVRQDSVTVQFHEMGNSSLNVFYAAIFEVTEHKEWLACRQEVFLEVIRLAHRMEVEFAFPSTSVYIEQMPGNPAEGDA